MIALLLFITIIALLLLSSAEVSLDAGDDSGLPGCVGCLGQSLFYLVIAASALLLLA